nr:MAG TPA: hypothetical protein [Caudoviricetes sp.]
MANYSPTMVVLLALSFSSISIFIVFLHRIHFISPLHCSTLIRS